MLSLGILMCQNGNGLALETDDPVEINVGGLERKRSEASDFWCCPDSAQLGGGYIPQWRILRAIPLSLRPA